MRTLLGVAFVVVTSVAAFTYRDLILSGMQRAPAPVRPALAVQRPPVMPKAAPPPEPITTTAQLAELNAIDSLVTMYIVAVQEDLFDARAMTDLAFLYMKQGWFDRAIGPLARAREIDATSEPLRRYLELAIARSGRGYVDLYQAARDFEEMVQMEGHGC